MTHRLEPLIARLSQETSVDLILPSDPRYPEARLVYNRMHDCYPGLIIRTQNVDVLRLVKAFSLENDIVLAIRGGGHHIGGFGTCNEGIVIDFSTFKRITIDTEKMIAAVDPGATLHDIDHVITGKGFVVPTGTVSETGVAGLTLGGGIGWLIGLYGLTCDQLCGADVLLADGQLVQAEDPKHQQLLWALRGGGGNFGMVLQFRYKLHRLPKTICGMGLVQWEHSSDVLNRLITYLHEDCPHSITIAPILTKDTFGKPTLRIDFCCANGTDDELQTLLSLSHLINWTEVREWSFAAWQKAFDASFLPPMRGYWKASYQETITPQMVQALCDTFEHSPSFRCSITIEHLHGAFKNHDQQFSAFPLRHCNFGILFSARWEKQDDDEAFIHWIRQSFSKLDPLGTSGTYLNYTGVDDQRAVDTLLASTMSQIAKVKTHYDPMNSFKRNHNVLPQLNDRRNNVVP